MPDRDARGLFLPGHSKAGPGRPPIYHEGMNEPARKLALLGLTDAEMAEFFGVERITFRNWLEEHPGFAASVAEGKTIADAEVADSLWRRATGETRVVEKVIKDPVTGAETIAKLTQYIPADPSAAKHWLSVRRRRAAEVKWDEKSGIELTGPNGGPIQTIDPSKLSDTALAELMAAMNAAPETDGSGSAGG